MTASNCRQAEAPFSLGPFASRMQSARIVLLLTTLSAFTAIAADSESHPIAARVVPVRSQSNLDWRPVGNISVTFSDGHEEMWTTSGHCLRPKASHSGLVGWTYGTAQHSRGYTPLHWLADMAAAGGDSETGAGLYCKDAPADAVSRGC
jgi:hypothetical protein